MFVNLNFLVTFLSSRRWLGCCYLPDDLDSTSPTNSKYQIEKI